MKYICDSDYKHAYKIVRDVNFNFSILVLLLKSDTFILIL